jgi:hypothetical protein
MSTPFEIPASLLPEPSSSPPPPPVDDHRVEDLVNGFIAGKQDALFEAPDAYYRQQGADAVDGAPAIAQRLQDLRAATLDRARDDGERAALEPRLDAHLDDAMDGIGRHVEAQQTVRQRQIIATRQALIQRAAALEHDNDDKIAGLADAHASAAQELARLSGVAPGSDDEADVLNAARSQILRTAIEQRIANARGAQAIDLHDRMNDALTPADRHALELPIAATRDDTATDAWLARQTGIDGPPLADRVGLDDTLPDTQRLILRAKIAARDSAAESSRVATVKGLDDQLSAAMKAIATQPSHYRIGTLNALASAYADAGAPEQANDTCRLAMQEAALLPFAQANVAAQQRRLDDFTGPERAIAEAIMNHQADAFAKDPYAAGIALYPDVGAPLPAEDAEGRLRQTRMIESMRDAPTEAVLTPVNASPADIHAAEATTGDQVAQAGPPEDQETTRRKAEELYRDQKTPRVPWESAKEQLERQNVPRVDHDAAAAELQRQHVEPKHDEPTKVPPWNDPSSEEWMGDILKLPDGSMIEDPFDDRRNYSGYVMAPANNLKEVAQAGREDGERYRAQVADPATASGAGAFKAGALFANVGTGGKFDTQREGNQLLGVLGLTTFVQHRQFLPIANINVGLYSQQFGLTLEETLKIAGLWARIRSSNYDPNTPYGLKPRTEYFIRKGYEIGQSGQLDSKSSQNKQP